MVLGEYESQKALSTTLPDNIAPVLGHGPLILDPSKAFFLCEFKHLGSRILSPPHLVSILKQLHLSPLSASPTGKFGFTVTTFKGYIPVNNTWCDTWEEFFARQFRAEIEWEQSVRGKDDDLQQLADRLLEVVIPRLLGPLQAGGRTITPVLCHGDLWHGNIELDIETQNPILFDSCCVYGHNECKS
jgi:fructosamine-3-kinase